MENDDAKAPNFLQLLQGLLDDHLGKEEFLKHFQTVIEHAQTTDKELAAKFAELSDLLTKRSEEIGTTHSQALAELEQKVNDLFVGDRLEEMRAEIRDALARADERVSSIKDGETPTQQQLLDLIEPLIPPAIPGKDGSPDTPEAIRDKLESLKEDERLDVSAIKGISELVKKEVGRNGAGGVIAIARGQVMVYDLSPQLNGVLKTFALPAFWRVNRVDLSSFPYGASRPTTDFTTDGAAMTITFTSEIDAATQLAEGQSCLVEYVAA